MKQKKPKMEGRRLVAIIMAVVLSAALLFTLVAGSLPMLF